MRSGWWSSGPSARNLTPKRGRRYSARNIAQLRLIQRLSQDEGINLEGIRRILVMQDEIDELRARVVEMNDLLALAREVRDGVHSAFGVRLVAEPDRAG